MRKGLTGDTSLSGTRTVYGTISTSLAAYSTKLVLAALQWSYEAKATDVQEKWLEQAAELLVLRHDTFEIIDGEGPEAGTEQGSETEKEAASETPAQQVSLPNEEQKPLLFPAEQETQAQSQNKEEAQPVAPGNCTFSGIVPIALQRFKQSGVSVVECPGCGRAWTLSPSGECCASNRTPGGKRILPPPDDGGPGGKAKRTGM